MLLGACRILGLQYRPVHCVRAESRFISGACAQIASQRVRVTWRRPCCRKRKNGGDHKHAPRASLQAWSPRCNHSYYRKKPLPSYAQSPTYVSPWHCRLCFQGFDVPCPTDQHSDLDDGGWKLHLQTHGFTSVTEYRQEFFRVCVATP